MNDASEWLRRARDLVWDETRHYPNSKSKEALETYLEEFDGRFFERLYGRGDPHRFTSDDVLAVTALSVVVPPPVAYRLTSDEGWRQANSLLAKIDSDLHIEDVTPNAFEKTLGEGSPAWALWELLDGLPGVGPTIAGKLLATKRPSLIPISDSYVKVTLGTDERNLWRCMWTVLTDKGIQDGVVKIKNEVAEARDLSLLRVVDIVAWRHGKRMQVAT